MGRERSSEISREAEVLGDFWLRFIATWNANELKWAMICVFTMMDLECVRVAHVTSALSEDGDEVVHDLYSGLLVEEFTDGDG